MYEAQMNKKFLRRCLDVGCNSHLIRMLKISGTRDARDIHLSRSTALERSRFTNFLSSTITGAQAIQVAIEYWITVRYVYLFMLGVGGWLIFIYKLSRKNCLCLKIIANCITTSKVILWTQRK